jgi:hypothetical protein
MNITCIFSTDFRKNNQISNFLKIRSVEALFFHADYRTDTHDEANSRFTQRAYELLQYFSARCNYAVLIKDSSLHWVNLISNNLLPTEACVLPNSILLIHKLGYGAQWRKKFISTLYVSPLTSKQKIPWNLSLTTNSKHSYTFYFILLLWEGRQGRVRKPPNKVMPFVTSRTTEMKCVPSSVSSPFYLSPAVLILILISTLIPTSRSRPTQVLKRAKPQPSITRSSSSGRTK